MTDYPLKSVREVEACEKHLGYALYRAVVDNCDAYLHLVLAHCVERAIKAAQKAGGGGVIDAIAIRREFGIEVVDR